MDEPRRQPKRVLLMVSSMRGGGSERQVLLLSRALDRARFAPHLYLTEATGSFLDQVPSDVVLHSFDGQADLSRVYVPGRQLRRQTEFVRSIIDRERIDVVYERTFHMTMLAGKAAAGIRRVATIVSPPHLALPMVEKRFVALKKRRLAAAYREADAVVAVSQQAADSAEAYYGLPTGSVTVIRNPIETNAASALVEPATSELQTSTRLICVGRMTEEKGHRDLIRAIALVRERWPESRLPMSVRFVGDGPLRGTLQEQVSTLGLDSAIEFVGAKESALSEIAASDALVLPSRFEGMPNVVLEAMAVGTPVIATRAGGTIELQRDEPTAFWATPGDSESIADAILEFAVSPEQAAKQASAALRLVKSQHDLQTAIGQIEDLLDPR